MPARPVILDWEGKAKSLTALSFPVPDLQIVEQPGALGVGGAVSARTTAEPGSSPPRVSLAPSKSAPSKSGAIPASGRLIHGDAVDVARCLAAEGLAGKVDLVYLDPPFGSGVDYTHEERLDGPATGKVARTEAYRDRWDDGVASYLDMLYPRLVALRPLLHATSSIWIHVDWRANYLVRALGDEIFGRERFLNEIVWRRAPNLGRQARSGQFGRTLDTLIVYGGGPEARLIPPERLAPVRAGSARLDAAAGRHFTVAPRGDYTDASVARLEAEGRVHRTDGGGVYVKYWLEHDAEGRLCKRQPVDALWTDVPPLRHVSPAERTGYPTQKPRALLERIIRAATPEGGLVVDLFSGSGTTGAAAAALARSFILGDASAVAIATARSRLLREGCLHLRLERCGKEPENVDGVDARATRAPGGEVHVLLDVPAGREPIAWAIDESPNPETSPFRPAWRAERGAGRKPSELPRQARLPLGASAESLRVRVFFVDGAMADVRVPVEGVHRAGLSVDGLGGGPP